MRIQVSLLLIIAAGLLLAAGRTGAVAEPPTLRVRIAVPERGYVMVRDTRSHFHVIIENLSDRPQAIIDEWNSWGHDTLRFEYTTADGKTVKMETLPKEWRKNFFTATTIPPGGVLVREVYLDETIWDHLPLVKGGESKVTLRAMFSQEDKSEESWHGTIQSAGQQMTFHDGRP